MSLNSTVVAKAQAETRGNFHSIQVTGKCFHLNFSILNSTISLKFLFQKDENWAKRS